MADTPIPNPVGPTATPAQISDPTGNTLVPRSPSPAVTDTQDHRALSVDLKDLRNQLVKGFEAETAFDKSEPKHFTDKQGIELPTPDDSALEQPGTPESPS